MAIVVGQAYQLDRAQLASAASPIMRMLVQRDQALTEVDLLRREGEVFRAQRQGLPPHRWPFAHARFSWLRTGVPEDARRQTFSGAPKGSDVIPREPKGSLSSSIRCSEIRCSEIADSFAGAVAPEAGTQESAGNPPLGQQGAWIMNQVKGSARWGVLAAVVVSGVLYTPTLVHQIAYAVTAGENKALRDHLGEMSKQDHMSSLFSAVAKAVQPAVVVVNVRQRVQAPTVPMPDMDEFMRRFFGDEQPLPNPGTPGPRGRTLPVPPQQPREFFAHGLGSGVIVNAEKGYVLTNWHVVREADDVEVTLADDRTVKAEWIRTDPQTDLAIIKIQTDGLVSAPLGNSDQMEVGNWVLAFGAPRGLTKTVTAGIISAMGRSTGGSGYENFLQTDAAINQGNSGGPLVNMKGEVIGINSAIVTHMGGNEGIGFAIPSNMVKQVMTQLIEKGKVTRGYLGVTIQNVGEDLAKSFNLPDSKGALVSGVADDSPASKAGLKAGDFIVSVDGKKVASVNELRNEVANIEPGKSVKLEYYREGKKDKADVKIEVQPKEMAGIGAETKPEAAKVDKFGIKVSGMSAELAQKYGYKETAKGVIVTAVDSASDAAEKGLQEGQTILQAGGKDISTPEELEKALSSKDAANGIRLLVTDHSGGKRFVFVKPGK